MYSVSECVSWLMEVNSCSNSVITYNCYNIRPLLDLCFYLILDSNECVKIQVVYI